MTASQQERQLENTRRQEEVREDSIRQLGLGKMLESNMSRAERLDEKRYIRRFMMEQKEREMEEAIMKVCIHAQSLDYQILFKVFIFVCICKGSD